MGRITITIPDERQRVLEAEAQIQGVSLEELIEARLQPSSREAADNMRALLEKAWAHSERVEPQLSEDEAMEFAIEQTRQVREEMWRERTGSATSGNP